MKRNLNFEFIIFFQLQNIQVLCISSCPAVRPVQNVHRDDFVRVNFPHKELGEMKKLSSPSFLYGKFTCTKSFLCTFCTVF